LLRCGLVVSVGLPLDRRHWTQAVRAGRGSGMTCWCGPRWRRAKCAGSISGALGRVAGSRRSLCRGRGGLPMAGLCAWGGGVRVCGIPSRHPGPRSRGGVRGGGFYDGRGPPRRGTGDVVGPRAAVRDLDEVGIRAAIAALPGPQRPVLAEVYHRDRSRVETARILGIPPGTVRLRTFYGLRAVRRAPAVHQRAALLPRRFAAAADGQGPRQPGGAARCRHTASAPRQPTTTAAPEHGTVLE